MWLEALVSKNILGKPRRVGDRFEGPLNAGMALMGGGTCRKVSGPHPAPDRHAPVRKPAAPKKVETPQAPETEAAPRYANVLARNDHNEMGDVLKAAGITVPRSKADRHAALLALQET